MEFCVFNCTNTIYIYIWIEHIFYVHTVYGCIGLKYVLNIHMEHTHKSLQKLQYKTGWWYTYPSETYEFVSWDDEIPNIWKVIEFHGSLNHQPEKESFHEASSNGMWLQGSVGVVVW